MPDYTATLQCVVRHAIGHFGDNLPRQPLNCYETPSFLSQSLGWYWRLT